MAVSGHASTPTLTILLFAFSAAIGSTFPNISALVLSEVRARVGSAAALQGTVHSVFGGIAGGLVGLLGNDTTLPMIQIIVGFVVLANIFLFAAHRSRIKS